MEEELKCFVCQSKSKSANDNSCEKQRRTNNIYNNLDPSTWKVFCHYFYPPPLVSLLVSSSSVNSPAPENEDNEDFSSIPVFCGSCCQTMLKLWHLHSQLELIQGQISKIVAQLSLDFVQESENHVNDSHNEEYNKSYKKVDCQRKRKEPGEQQCDDDVIYSMRQCIRRRYQPSVCMERTNLDIQNQSGGIINNLDVGELSSLSIHSGDLKNPNLDSADDFPHSMKQEDGNSINITIFDMEELEGQENFNEDQDPNLSLDDNKNENTNNPSEENENGCHGNQGQDSESGDPDYDPIPDSDADDDNIADKKGQVQGEEKSSDSSRTVTKAKRKTIGAPIQDPKVGENIYEYDGKWRYERKKDERDGHFKSFCLSCPIHKVRAFRNRGGLITHIDKRHIKEIIPRNERVQKLDDNTFLYDGPYLVSRVTEPNGIFYKCGTCSVLKKTFAMIKIHIRQTHIEGVKLTCDQCGKYSTMSKHHLKLHMETHVQDKTYICEACGKGYKTATYLNSHQKSVHGEKIYVCDCGKKFGLKKALHDHARKFNHPIPDVHPAPEDTTPFAPRTCNLCKREFVLKETFQKHVLICQAGVKKACEFCGRIFQNLRLHLFKGCPGRPKQQKQA